MVKFWNYVIKKVTSGLEERVDELSARVDNLVEVNELLIMKVSEFQPGFDPALLLDSRSPEELDAEIQELKHRRWELSQFSPVSHSEIKQRNNGLAEVDRRVVELEGLKSKLLLPR